MATIGNLATMLTANAEPLGKGLEEAAAHLKRFDDSVIKGLSAQTAAAEKLKSALTGLGGVAAGMATALVGNAFSTAEMLNNTRLQSEKLGLSLEQMASVEKFAGNATGELSRSDTLMNADKKTTEHRRLSALICG